MIQQLPDDRHRYVVVNATDGQPIAGAKIYMDLYHKHFLLRIKGCDKMSVAADKKNLRVLYDGAGAAPRIR